MTETIIISLLGTATSIAVAIYSAMVSNRNSKKLELLKNNLEQEKADKNAKRDYEYEAKKRLYQAYEPLFFQLSELSEIALSRLEGMAKNYKEGLFKSEWEGFNSYYFKETVYKLFAPLAIIKLINDKLTTIDLSIDENLSCQYGLLKTLYFSLQEDGKLASIIGDLDYLNKWKENYRTDLAEVDRQAINLSELDKITKLFVSEKNGNHSLLEIGDFEDLLIEKSNPKIQRSVNVIEKLFKNFSPEKKRVLWTLLLSHACIYKILIDARFDKNLNKEKVINLATQFYAEMGNDFSTSENADVNSKFLEGSKKYIIRQINKRIR